MTIDQSQWTDRQAMIAELEELGFDGTATAKWRETFSNQNLRDTLEVWRARGEKPTDGEVPDADTLPDLDEIVAAIRETVAAADAFNAAHPEIALPETPGATGWETAFNRLRDLDNRITTSMEKTFAR